MTILGVKFPGHPETDYLCFRCQQAWTPELKARQQEERAAKLQECGGVQKPRERTYDDLGLSLQVVSREIESYLNSNGFRDVAVQQSADKTVVIGGDLAVVVTGTPECVKVAAGPREILLDASTALGMALVVSPLFAIAKGIGVAWDKWKVDRLFAHLDSVLYARASRVGGDAARESSGSVADRIRELGKLRDEGLLSEDDFQAKKQELLSKL